MATRVKAKATKKDYMDLAESMYRYGIMKYLEGDSYSAERLFDAAVFEYPDVRNKYGHVMFSGIPGVFLPKKFHHTHANGFFIQDGYVVHSTYSGAKSFGAAIIETFTNIRYALLQHKDVAEKYIKNGLNTVDVNELLSLN
jgi:hypothetical protein